MRTWISSRTDRGVHARGLAVLVHTASMHTASALKDLNRVLATQQDIICHDVQMVGNPDFHPSQDAVAKRYTYSCVCGAENGMDQRVRSRAWYVPQMLDAEAMRRAAMHLVGRPMDFSAFRGSGCSVSRLSPMCCLESIEVASSTSPHGVQQHVAFDVVGNRFLYKMVRRIVGTLVAVGKGDMPGDDIPRLLEARRRGATDLPPAAPAHGLCLEEVRYPHRCMEAQPVEIAPGSQATIVSGLYLRRAGVVTGGRHGYVQIRMAGGEVVNTRRVHVR